MTDTAHGRRKQRKPPLVVETELASWGPRGATRATVDGRSVLIDRGIPGERVVASVVRGRQPWRGMVDQVVQPAAARIAPPCPYFVSGCGGCQWQHIEYGAQTAVKRALVDRELAGQGVRARVQGIQVLEEPWRYRRTAAIALGWEAGFRPRGRRGIVEIHDCLIAHPAIGSLAADLNLLLRDARIPNYHGKVWLDCTVAGSEALPELQVVIQGIEGLTLERYPELPDVAAAIADLANVTSVSFRHRSGEPVPLVGDLFAQIEVDGQSLTLPAGSFFQTNLRLLPAVIQRMRDVLEGRGIRAAADVYGGVGTFGLALADSVERMTIVELDALAVQAAERTARQRGLQNVNLISEHAERALPHLNQLDLVIVDPPRSGLGDVVVAALLTIQPPLVLYVSCAPTSLARDLALLEAGGYQVSSLQLYDFYPQTYHVESLTVLER